MPSGVLPDERTFQDISEFQRLLAADSRRLLRNLGRQFAIYGAGRDLAFSDRQQIDDIVDRAETHGGGIRTLIHELIQSSLFQTK